MERFYHFAGITFRISGIDDQMYLEDGLLTPYRVDGPAADHNVELEIVTSLPAPQGTAVYSDARKRVYQSGDAQLYCIGEVANAPEDAHMHILRRGRGTRVQVLRRSIPDRIMPRLVLNAIEAEYHIIQHNGFLLHASFIRWKGKAILFTAPSGTGKSTQAELWCRLRGAELVNGDRVAVMVKPDGVMACGVPFCGTSGVNRNAVLPVAAIVCLAQAQESTIVPLTGLQAFRRIWEGCSVHVWNKEIVEHCTQTVINALQQVPVFYLACRPDESAVSVLEKVLEEGM